MELFRAAAVRRVITPVAAAALVLGGCAPLVGARSLATMSPDGTTFHTIAVGAERRGFLLHRPATARARLPVLFVLHGTSANANVVMDESGMNAIADSIGALVVYPNGTGGIPYVRLFWNTDHCCATQPRDGADEIEMVRAIVDSLAGRFPVDRSRVGLIGFSDAGTMAYLMACDARTSGMLSAIGVISGEVPAGHCTPPVGVSTIVFHGTADHNIHYGQTAENVAAWAQRERCTQSARDTLPSVERRAFTHCADGAEVALYTILGGRHAWPGGKRSNVLAPRPTREVDASRLFAAFVLSHPRDVR
jgi:polyhydroxybutyrate depolymerase